MNAPKQPLFDVWSWIPAFHVVASTGGITAAAKSLSLSPPAVSKSIKTLESRLGRPLFTRTNRGVELTASGRALYRATRSAIADLELGMVGAGLNRLESTMRVATMGSLDRSLMVPTAQRLRGEHPGLKFSVTTSALPNESLDALKRESLDVLLAVNVAVGTPFVSEFVSSLPMGVYVARMHPSYSEPDLDDEAIGRLSFVAQAPLEGMKPIWPRGRPRDVQLEVDSHGLALQACLEAGYAMVMGRAAAAPYVDRGELRELLPGFLEPATVSLIVLDREREDPAVRLMVDATREVARAWGF